MFPKIEKFIYLISLVPIILAVIAVMFLAVRDKLAEVESETAPDEALNLLREGLKNLQNQFPNQTRRFWTVSLAAVRPLLDSPKHPAVILLTASKRMQPTTDCLARRISEAVDRALGATVPPVFFNSHVHKDSDDEAVKREMDQLFTQAFEEGSRVGVVLGLESLPGKAPMIFYRLCDTANAPFKNVVFVMTLNAAEREVDGEEDTAVYDELTRLWENVLDPDQVDPLFSRIGNSVAHVREEDNVNGCSDNDN